MRSYLACSTLIGSLEVSSSVNLRPETVTLLQQLTAARMVRPDTPYCYRPINGYDFAWILHPGFDDGTRLSGIAALSELERTGLLTFSDDRFPRQSTTFLLADAGISDGSVSRETRRSDRVSQHVAVDESNLSA